MSDLVLYMPPGRPWGMPNMSPFCGKLETYLRMAEVPYRAAAAGMTKAPKGKIPYIGIDGGLLGDSQLIIEELERRAGDKALDAQLSARERATGHAVRRMLDEAFYFVLVHLRWGDDGGFRVLDPEFRKIVPRPLRFLMRLIRRSIRKSARTQGLGRHSHDEIAAIGSADLDAVAELLGDRPFLLGDRPRTVDASAFAFVDAVLTFPHDSAVKARAAGHANLVAYRARVRERWWKDLEASSS